MARKLSLILSDMAAALAAGAVSSQLDASVVVKFAALSAEAHQATDVQLKAITADAVADMAADVAALQLAAPELAAEMANLRTQLDQLKAECAGAAAQLETIRGQINEAAAAAGQA